MPRVDDILSSALQEAVESVFEKMMGWSARRLDDSEVSSGVVGAIGETMFTASLGLAGAWQGTICLHCDRASLRGFLCRLLNDTREPMRDEDLADCLGELCNILCGAVKPSLPAPTNLGLPSVVIGCDYQLHPGRALVRAHQVFAVEERRLEVLVLGPVSA